MLWLIFLGNLAKILFLDSHAKNLQVRTYLDVFLVSTKADNSLSMCNFSKQNDKVDCIQQRIKPKAHLNGPANLAWSFLAGILSEPILDSDWSPISFQNIKIFSLKRAQSI